MSGKNLRLLGIEPSPATQPDIHEMIAGLKSELEKGLGVYSPAELTKLEMKLADYELMLQRLNSH
jgi:hypothetical protein